ncbi:hypothetical protein BJY04DRAFT_212355 [Aspergillus karnatakaensis]|uniref:uncharacterized protein n=1 Tax=Aspergillus karnatakaensis TaxID=1810916 RepID=UPI003CCCA154
MADLVVESYRSYHYGVPPDTLSIVANHAFPVHLERLRPRIDGLGSLQPNFNMSLSRPLRYILHFVPKAKTGDERGQYAFFSAKLAISHDTCNANDQNVAQVRNWLKAVYGEILVFTSLRKVHDLYQIARGFSADLEWLVAYLRNELHKEHSSEIWREGDYKIVDPMPQDDGASTVQVALP